MASGGLIGALRVTLAMDSAQFESGAKKARGVAKREIGEIERIAGGAKLALAGMFSAATITAFGAAAKRALDYAGGLGEIAQQAGISTKALQEQAAIGIDVGLSLDDVASANARLSKAIGSAQDGNKKASETFRQLGIDVNGLTAESAMPKLIAAFERIKSPTDQARIAAELFGRSAGSKMLPMLNMTVDGFNGATAAAHEFGLVLSDEAIASADAASDAMSRLAKVVEINFAAAMAGGADGVAAMADELAKMVARLPGQIESIRNFAFASAEALRQFGGFGEFIANKAKRASATGLNDKQFAAAQRQAAQNLRANPNDPEARAYANFLLQQGKSREARANRPAPSAPSVGDIVPRTDRGGGGGKSKKAPRDRSADYIERYNRELASLLDAELSIQADLTSDVEMRSRIEQLRIGNEQKAYEEQLARRVKEGELTQTQADDLRIQNQKVMDGQRGLEIQRRDVALNQQALDIATNSIEIENNRLRVGLDAARTQEDRRRIMLAILDNEQKLERLSLQAIIDKETSNDAERKIAQAKLEALDAERSGKVAAIGRDTMGPLERWMDEAPKTAAEMREAFQEVTVDALNSSLDLATRNMFKLKGAAGELMNQILSDLIRIQLRSAISKGGGLGGIISAIGAIFGLGAKGGSPGLGVSNGSIDWAGLQSIPTPKLPGLATGGSFMAGGMPGIDRNVLAINGVPKVRVSANERINVTRAGQDNKPVVVQIIGEEGAAFVPRVAGISGNVSTQQISGVSRMQARKGRSRLA